MTIMCRPKVGKEEGRRTTTFGKKAYSRQKFQEVSGRKVKFLELEKVRLNIRFRPGSEKSEAQHPL